LGGLRGWKHFPVINYFLKRSMEAPFPQKGEESFSTTLVIGENTNIGSRKSPTY
jgi:hypothetical protein